MVKSAWLFGLLTLMLMFAGCAGDIAFKNGEKMTVEGDLDRAVAYYRQALQEDPENISYKTRLTSAQRDAAQVHVDRSIQYLNSKNADVAIYEAQQALLLLPENARAAQLLREAGKLKELQGRIASGRNFYFAGRPNEAIEEFTKVLDIDPEQAEAKSYIEKITRQKAAIGGGDEGLTLASDQPITLSFKDAKLKEVFEFLSKLSGVSILFDDDVKDQPVTVFAKDISFNQALNLLLATNKLFMKKIAQDAIIIIPKTKSKQDQYQDLLIKTFYLSNIQAKDMVNILRTMLETRKVIINEQLNSVTLRETPDKLKLAEKLIEVNDRKDSEVIIDVEVMSVDRGDNLKYGLNLPKSITGTYVPPAAMPASGIPDLAANVVTNLTNLSGSRKDGKWKENIWISYPSVTADWAKSKSHAETLTNPSIRALNNKPAKILIGRRIPVQTGQTSGVGGVTTTAFEYRDVGIKLTVEPDIGLNNDVKLKATLEVSSLGDPIVVGDLQQPSFNTTTAESVLSLKDGETAVVGGLLENVNSSNMSGVAGIMDIPILGKIFSTNNVGPNSKRELIMTLTPHIVRPQVIPSADYTAFYSGTEEAYDTKPLFEEKKEKLSVPEEDVAPAEQGKVPSAQQAPPGQLGAPGKPKKAQIPEGQSPPMPTQKIGRVGVINFAPEVVPIEVGQELTVDVVATDLDSVFEAPLSIIYNPKLVEFVKSEEGEFMKVDGKPTSFTATANDKIGFIDVFLTRLGKVQGVSGSGRLFSLTFKGKAPGISPLVFKQNMLKDANKQPVSADLKTGTLYVK